MADSRETIAKNRVEVSKPCIYCEQYDFCPIANRGGMVADWCPYDNHDFPVLEPKTEQENNLPFQEGER